MSTQNDPFIETARAKLQEMPTLAMMVMCLLELVRSLAVRLLEEELQRRALATFIWPRCHNCGKKLHRYGFRDRKILTLFGWIHWKRRIGRCPSGCNGENAPLDKQLDIQSHQRTSFEVKRLACMLVILVPFKTACRRFQQMTGIALSPDALWTWCQELGQRMDRHKKGITSNGSRI